MPTMHKPAPRCNSAFTLIELLVVIAIIAILAAILFPVFATVREKARQTSCLSNMKQIGTAILAYTQDYDEMIVPSQNGTSGKNLVSWPSIIFPYVQSANVFVCASASEGPTTMDTKYIAASPKRFYMGITLGENLPGNAGDGSDPAFSRVPRLSYSRNLIPTTNGSPWNAIIAGRKCNNGKTYPGFVDYVGNLKSGWVGTGTTFTRSMAEIPDPAGTIHIVDGMAGGGATVDTKSYGASIRGLQQDIRTDMFPDATPSKVAPRHTGGFVILYGDGHSGYKKWGSTTPCMWTIQDDQCN